MGWRRWRLTHLDQDHRQSDLSNRWQYNQRHRDQFDSRSDPAPLHGRVIETHQQEFKNMSTIRNNDGLPRKRRRAQGGNNLVEFGIILPVLCFVVVGMIDFGMLFY